MRTVGVEDTALTAVVDDAAHGSPSIITRDGRPEAVVLAYAEWEMLSRIASFGELLAASPIEPGDLPERDRTPPRDLGF